VPYLWTDLSGKTTGTLYYPYLMEKPFLESGRRITFASPKIFGFYLGIRRSPFEGGLVLIMVET